MEDKALMRILNIVLTAYWFFQVDALWMHIAQWNLRINPPVLDDALELAKNFLNAELESIAAAEAEADEEKAG